MRYYYITGAKKVVELNLIKETLPCRFNILSVMRASETRREKERANSRTKTSLFKMRLGKSENSQVSPILVEIHRGEDYACGSTQTTVKPRGLKKGKINIRIYRITRLRLITKQWPFDRSRTRYVSLLHHSVLMIDNDGGDNDRYQSTTYNDLRSSALINLSQEYILIKNTRCKKNTNIAVALTLCNGTLRQEILGEGIHRQELTMTRQL